MDICDAARQVTEINTIQSQPRYEHAVKITTPTLFNRLERSIASLSSSSSSNSQLPVKKCLSIQIKCQEIHPDELSELVLSVEFPLDYPSRSVCRVGVDNESFKFVGENIELYLEKFSGCECLELILDWLSENKATCLLASSTDNANGINEKQSNSDNIECYILRYNHLLSGPEHKKEKSLLDAAKKTKLQGGLLWGTPGIVVLVPPVTLEDANEYAAISREIGKRADGVNVVSLPRVAVEEGGLGELAWQKRGGRLKELDTGGLRVVCGGDEDLLRLVLGVK